MVTYEFRLVCENVYVPYNLFVLKCLKNQPNQTLYIDLPSDLVHRLIHSFLLFVCQCVLFVFVYIPKATNMFMRYRLKCVIGELNTKGSYLLLYSIPLRTLSLSLLELNKETWLIHLATK